MTFNSLVSLVTAYLNREDAATLTRIPDFINQAEQRICRESKNIGLSQYVVGSFVTAFPVIAKPARWRRTLSFNYGTGTVPNRNTSNQMFLRSYEFLRQYWPDDTQTSLPKFYADYGYEHFLVAPTPDSDYPFELSYLELPEPLTSINQTNWLTNYAPDLILYGTLLEAVPFLKNDERIPVWEKYYDRALSSINSQDDLRKQDRSSNRSAD